jgi:hypothetical protein
MRKRLCDEICANSRSVARRKAARDVLVRNGCYKFTLLSYIEETCLVANASFTYTGGTDEDELDGWHCRRRFIQCPKCLIGSTANKSKSELNVLNVLNVYQSNQTTDRKAGYEFFSGE